MQATVQNGAQEKLDSQCSEGDRWVSERDAREAVSASDRGSKTKARHGAKRMHSRLAMQDTEEQVL